jgi:hypothetical protein
MARVDDEIGREDERARRCGCRWKMGQGGLGWRG